MDEIGGAYAKLNKLKKDRYCMTSIMRNLKKSRTQKQCRKVVARAWSGGKRNVFVKHIFLFTS